MSDVDYVYLNVPALLQRKALITSSNGTLVEDKNWSERLKERLVNLVKFFQDNNLLTSKLEGDVSRVIILYSHFNGVGQQFIKSGAPDKWLASFDRQTSKPASDVSYLVKRLQALNGTTRDRH